MFKGLFKKPDYRQLLNNGAVIIDVRNHNEYESGAIPGSENIPLGNFPKEIDKIKSLGVPVIVVCAAGIRAQSAKSMLKSKGVEAYNGGAWTKMIPFID